MRAAVEEPVTLLIGSIRYAEFKDITAFDWGGSLLSVRTAYMVAQRTNEVGIRLALGADRAQVIQLMLRRALRRLAAGLVVGLPLAVSAARFLAEQLYGVSFWDPVALAVAGGSLAGCAFFAAIIPASRDAALSPMSALRAG